jgi:hypothetical protein
VADKKPRRELVALAEALPPADPSTPEPPLGAAQLHAALDRANIRHLELVDELRTLKAHWARRNIEASQCHQSIPTAEIKHVEAQRRSLHLALEQTQSEIGRLNKLSRELKARQAVSKPAKGITTSTIGITGADSETAFFILAAKNELDPAMYDRIERIAAAMQRDAKKMGLD